MTIAQLVLEESVLLGCGEPFSYYCRGHVDRATFKSLIQQSSKLIGFHATLPDHVDPQHVWQRQMPPNGNFEIQFIHHKRAVRGAYPITLVWADEIDEVTP